MQFSSSILALILSTIALASASVIDARQRAVTVVKKLGVTLTLNMTVGSVQDNTGTIIVKDESGNTVVIVAKS